MADVTVLGAGGATVTITLTSAENAAAAQLAVNKTNALTALGIVDVQTQSGAGTLPAVQQSLAAAIFTGKGFIGTTGDQYVLLGGQGGDAQVLGGRNANTTVVIGNNTDMVYSNQSSNAQVFLGKNNAAIANYEGKVTATTEDGSHLVAADSDSTTTVNLGAGGLLNIIDLGEGLGAATVNALGSGTINAFASSASVSGVVNMSLSTGDVAIGLVGMSAVINPGAARTTIIGDVGASATLFGGTGSVTVNGVAGSFTGGSAGGNQMFSSTVSGSTTLTGGAAVGAPGDSLGARGANQTLIAGNGNATLAAVQALGATGGSTFNVGTGTSTVFGFEGGGSTVNVGGTGITQVLGRNGALTGDANSYNDLGTGSGQVTIHDFTTGLDTLSVKGDFTITFFAIDDAANTTGSEVTLLQVVGGASYTFFDSTPDGVANISASDVTKIG